MIAGIIIACFTLIRLLSFYAEKFLVMYIYIFVIFMMYFLLLILGFLISGMLFYTFDHTFFHSLNLFHFYFILTEKSETEFYTVCKM